jgi:hypothetical protein
MDARVPATPRLRRGSPALARRSLGGGGKRAHDDRKTGEKTYASPSVSNIAALMASSAVLPAQTTNWNAG